MYRIHSEEVLFLSLSPLLCIPKEIWTWTGFELEGFVNLTRLWGELR